jgi:hypothetical protein
LKQRFINVGYRYAIFHICIRNTVYKKDSIKLNNVNATSSAHFSMFFKLITHLDSNILL